MVEMRPLEVDQTRVERDNSPVTTAIRLLASDGVPTETRPPSQIATEFLTLSRDLEHRWDLITRYTEWLSGGRDAEEEEPTFWDESTQQLRSAKFALAPCPLVNDSLNKTCYKGFKAAVLTVLVEAAIRRRPDWERLSDVTGSGSLLSTVCRLEGVLRPCDNCKPKNREMRPLEVDQTRVERDNSPVTTAIRLLASDGVPTETRPPSQIATEFLSLSRDLEHRWDLITRYTEWLSGGRDAEEPTFWDESTQQLRSAKFALAPCPLVNDSLNKTVNLTLRKYSKSRYQAVMRQLKERKSEVATLRNICIHAEGSMENEALDIIFKTAHNLGEGLPRRVRDTATELRLQNANPSEYPGLVFLYFENYVHLVKAELQLLKVPGILQNGLGSYNYPSTEELFSNNPVLRSILEESTRNPDLYSFVSSFPELFGHRTLKDKTFTFVGAGFPLTGIILHIETGASINLIDYDITAVDNARRFLALTEKLGITAPGAFKVIHADARDVVYIPA
eukprot:sb/3464002/